MLRPVTLAICLVFMPLWNLQGCSMRSAAVREPVGAARGVDVSEQPAPLGAKLLGPVEAVHGEGCGVLGKQGTREGALSELREAAARRGGDYVRLQETVEPHSTRACFDHEYRLRGLLYRKGRVHQLGKRSD